MDFRTGRNLSQGRPKTGKDQAPGRWRLTPRRLGELVVRGRCALEVAARGLSWWCGGRRGVASGLAAAHVGGALGCAGRRRGSWRGHGVVRRRCRAAPAAMPPATAPAPAATGRAIIVTRRPEQVVLTAIKALETGKTVTVDGWLNRQVVLAQHILPRSLITRLIASRSRPPRPVA